jgi:hypothetical protein
MILLFDEQLDELLARGGSYDITGTDAVIDKQFWGFNASDGAVIAVIKGVALKTAVTDLASIRAAEVDISAIITNDISQGLFAGTIYRADGYIITNIDLTSGSLHAYKTNAQISS